MPSVLFVCTANICRSPVAEVLFQAWLRRQEVPGAWRVSSAGTWASAGANASIYSQQVVAQRGLSLAQHKARAVDAAMLAASDVVLCMAHGHREALHVEFPQHAARIHLWTALAGPGYDVADPFGGSLAGFDHMATEMEELVEKTGARIVELARASQVA